jgi:hypothetical protein
VAGVLSSQGTSRALDVDELLQRQAVDVIGSVGFGIDMGAIKVILSVDAPRVPHREGKGRLLHRMVLIWACLMLFALDPRAQSSTEGPSAQQQSRSACCYADRWRGGCIQEGQQGGELICQGCSLRARPLVVIPVSSPSDL